MIPGSRKATGFHAVVTAAMLIVLWGAVSCSDNARFREPVGQISPGPAKNTKLSAVQCAVNDGRVDEDLILASGKPPNVLVCKVTAEGKNRAESQPVRFSVRAQNKAFKIHLRTEVELPTGVEKKIREGVFSQLRSCFHQFQEVWRRSDLGVDLDIVLVGESGEESSSSDEIFDQLLTFVRVTDAPEGDLGFVLNSHSDGARFWPVGQGEDLKNCSQKDKYKQRRCENEMKTQANAAFCQQLAQTAAGWLGLNEPQAVQDRCGDPTFTVGSKRGFRTATFAAQTPEEFWKQAYFSQTDLETILSPVCSVHDRG